MEPSPRKCLDVVGRFLPFNVNVVGPNVKRFIKRSMAHMSAHVYTKKGEVSQRKENQKQILIKRAALMTRNFNKNHSTINFSSLFKYLIHK